MYLFVIWRYLTTNTVQTKRYSVNTIDLKKITCSSEIDKNDTKSMNEFTWKNILHRYKNRSKKMSNLNLYKYTSSYCYKDKVIHSQLFGHKREISYPPGEVFSKVMLTLYKPWIKNVDTSLDKPMRNPKDSFSRHLRGHMSHEVTPKEIMMKIHCAKIALNFIVQKKRILAMTINTLQLLIVKMKLWLVLRKYIVNLLKT